VFVDTGIDLDLPAGASQKPRLPERSQILEPVINFARVGGLDLGA